MGLSKIHLVAAAGALLLVGGIALYLRPNPNEWDASPPTADSLPPGPLSARSADLAPRASAPTPGGSDDSAAKELVEQMDPEALREAPPLVYVGPSQGRDGRQGSIAMNGKSMGRSVNAMELLATAYGMSRSRIRLADGVRLPEGRFDFLVTLASGQKEALQQAIREKLGLIAHPGTREEEAFVMTARPGEFQNRRPSEGEAGRTRVRNEQGELNLENASIRALIGNLEPLLGLPVVDESGLRGRFDMVLTLEPQGNNNDRPSAESVKKAASEQLGLDLQREKRELEVLMVEPVGKG